MNRIDFVFSYWIFLWYILYEFKITQYNPKWALTFGLIENIFAVIILFKGFDLFQLILYSLKNRDINSKI